MSNADKLPFAQGDQDVGFAPISVVGYKILFSEKQTYDAFDVSTG